MVNPFELSSEYPSAIVRPNGQLLHYNALFSNQLQEIDVLDIYQNLQFSGQRSQVHVINNDSLLKAKLVSLPDEQSGENTPFSSDALWLEWTPINEAELRLAFFQIVSKAVNSSLIMDEIFDVLAEEIQRFIPYQSGTIVILDESQNITKVVVKLDEDGTARIVADIQEFVGYDPMMKELLHQPQSKVLSRHEYTDSLLIDGSHQQNLLVPLVAKGYVIGFISLAGTIFTTQSVNLLEDISEQLAVAVENARLYWRTQNQASREFLINHITKAIRNSLEIQTILQTTVDEVGRVLGVSRCIIHYWGQHGETFQYTIPGVPKIINVSEFASFENKLFVKRQNQEGQYNPFVLNDVRDYQEGFTMFEDNQIKSLAVFPILMSNGEFVGTISLQQCDHYRAWLNEDNELLKALAEHVSVALHQANLFMETEMQRKQLEVTLEELQTAQMHLIQSEKMAVLGQFVAGIAHEVNTPLGTIMANEDTVSKCIESISKNPDQVDKYSQAAKELLLINRIATERIEEIVKNLRNFARLDESDMKTVDLHEGLDATILLIKRSLGEDIELVKEYETCPSVECYPGLLNQVILNMLVNATQSIHERMDELKASGGAYPGQIILATHYNEPLNMVTVSIRDNGKGIAPENLSKIFDPGFTTKGVGVGTGLGLALCFKIIEKHQGHIRVDSRVGQGTTFHVDIPVRYSQAALPKPSKAIEDHSFIRD